MDDWQDIEDDDYSTIATPPSNTLCKDLHREPSLNELLRQEQQQLTNRVTQYHMVAEDPVHEVLTMTQNIASLVGQISKNIPDLVNDAMLASTENIEQRVVLAVRQNSKVVDLLPLTAQITATSEAQSEKIAQLTVQTENFRHIIHKPQRIPQLFYTSTAIVGFVTIAAAGFTWKSTSERLNLMNERLAVVEWANSPDGKLAKTIVTVNKGRLNQQCLQSASTLKTKVIVNGIDRQKICLIAIP